MKNIINLKYKPNTLVKILIVVTLTILYISRIIVFANKHGGVEHDSGWHMSIARNLADRGLYASYTNTSLTDDTIVNSGLHGRPAVQNEEGYNIFPMPTTMSAGPGSIIPMALIYKIFGVGWWQNRIIPLISATILSLITLYFLLNTFGLLSLTLFFLWIWFVPRYTMQFGYDSFPVNTGLIYLFCSMYFLCSKFKSNEITKKNYVLSGLFLGVACYTKMIYSFCIPAFLIIMIMDAFRERTSLKATIKPGSLFFCGMSIPIFSFELYRLGYFLYKFNFAAYMANNKAFWLFQSVASGTGKTNQHQFTWPFIYKKIMIWHDLGITSPIIFWLILLGASFFSYKSIKDISTKRVFVMIFFCFLFPFIWFLTFSPLGWFRYVWYASYLAIGIFAISGSFLLRLYNKKIVKVATICSLSILIAFLFYGSTKLNGRFSLTDQDVWNWRSTRFTRGLMGLPTNETFPLKDQQEFVSFANRYLNKSDHIFFTTIHKVTEMPHMIDKVFFPLTRYLRNPARFFSGNNYIVFGPFQVGRLRFAHPRHVHAHVKKYCEKMVFKNNSYAMCLLK